MIYMLKKLGPLSCGVSAWIGQLSPYGGGQRVPLPSVFPTNWQLVLEF